jgi:hypothetical protein
MTERLPVDRIDRLTVRDQVECLATVPTDPIRLSLARIARFSQEIFWICRDLISVNVLRS